MKNAICLNCSWRGNWKETICDVGQWGTDKRCPDCKVSGKLELPNEYEQVRHNGWKCIVNPYHTGIGGLLFPHHSEKDFMWGDCVCGLKNAIWNTPDNQKNICSNCGREYERGLFIFWKKIEDKDYKGLPCDHKWEYSDGEYSKERLLGEGIDECHTWGLLRCDICKTFSLLYAGKKYEIPETKER